MRLWPIALPMLIALSSTAQAEQAAFWCGGTQQGDGTVVAVSDPVLLTYSAEGRQRLLGQLADSFREERRSRGVEMASLDCFSLETVEEARRAVAEWFRARPQHRMERTGPVRSTAVNANEAERRAPASSANARPDLFLVLPSRSPNQQTSAEAEAARRAVEAQNARQLQRARAVDAENARRQAAHQAEVAANARRQAAHRTQLADHARRQAAYERARAEWTARVASCQAGNRDACGAQVTPQ